jgi:hypothetical protein
MKTNKNALFSCIILFIFCLYSLAHSSSVEILPYVDGSYSYFNPQYECYCQGCGPSAYFDLCYPIPAVEENMMSGIHVSYLYTWIGYPNHSVGTSSLGYSEGLMEFNLLSAVGMLNKNQFTATLVLTVKNVTKGMGSLAIGNIKDQTENGFIEIADGIREYPVISTINFNSLQPGDSVVVDVTASVQHDLFDAGQSNYSGFILSTYDIDCTFYDHTDSVLGPRLLIEGSTLISIASIDAKPFSGGVSIQWSTESEIDNAGFNIYRATSENGDYEKINSSLISANGSSTQGSSYEFTDNNVQNRKTYYYKLEDIDLNGNSTMHGPVSATPRLIYGIGKQLL